MKPTIGRIVHYKLSAYDAEAINRRRNDFVASTRTRTGWQAHYGNSATAGDVYPALIVRVFDDAEDGTGTSNLQVSLDGNDTYWATSRKTGDEPGTWAWPARS